MKINIKQRKVKIITEIHPQHLGSMNEAKRMVLQSKIGGADFVKIQLYDSKKLFNNLDRLYLQFSKEEFLELVNSSFLLLQAVRPMRTINSRVKFFIISF